VFNDPAVLNLLGIDPPAAIRGATQSPIEGVSFAATFDDPSAPTEHVTQYFEMFGHRAIDHDGWRAVCPWPGADFTTAATKGREFISPITPEVLDELETDGWEPYQITDDPTESRNVAADHPDKLHELVRLWWVEAGKYKVLPIDSDVSARLVIDRPMTSRPRTRFTYYPGLAPIPQPATPKTVNRPRSIEAEVTIPSGGADGVLLAQGGAAGGFAFYIKDGRLRYGLNYIARDFFGASSSGVVPEGRHILRFAFEPTGSPDFSVGKGSPGRFQLYVDGDFVGAAEVPHVNPTPSPSTAAGLFEGRGAFGVSQEGAERSCHVAGPAGVLPVVRFVRADGAFCVSGILIDVRVVWPVKGRRWWVRWCLRAFVRARRNALRSSGPADESK